MLDDGAGARERRRKFLWLKSEVTFLAVLVSARRLLRVLHKFSPDQPRVPAGNPGGGRWTSPSGGTGTGADGSTPEAGPTPVLFTDESGGAPWDFFVNTYSGGDLLAAQLVSNRDETTTQTEWDVGAVEPWATRQTLFDASRSVISTTTLNPDATGQIKFGPGADGALALTAVEGQLALTSFDAAQDGTVALAPTAGDIIRPLSGRAVQVLEAGGAAGSGAFLVGMTAFASPAGADSITPLSDDIRVRLADDGRPPIVEQRSDGRWLMLPDVPVGAGPAGTYLIDGDRLKGAIGETRFDSLGNLDGLGVALAMQPAPVAPRDVPPGSIFTGAEAGLYSPQGTIVDWSQPYAQAGAGQATVLELREPGLRGLTWTSGMDKPMIGALDIEQVDRSCPRFSDVHQVAVEADARVRAENPGLSARELGTLIHREIASDVGKWPEIKIGIWSEQGSFHGIGTDATILPKGAVRFDVLEDAGQGAVCIYDPKTGDTEMSPRQMTRYWQEARTFRTGTTRVYVIPIYTKR